MRRITAGDIEQIRAPWVWDLGNRVLYDLCREHPDHATDDKIIAKVWLIGRSYSASIERRRVVTEIGDDFYEAVVAPEMRRSEIDQWLASIPQAIMPGDRRTVVTHKKLMDLFHAMTGLEKRSLASKYLHFHKPNAFFIYDSRARQAIMKVVPRFIRSPEDEADGLEFDPEYRNFVRRCLWLREEVKATLGHELNPREVDKLLLMIADKELRSQSR
jgi:hypothetical protein